MQMYDSIEEAIKDHPNAYIAFQKVGACMVCKQTDDLRSGVCFNCSPKVSGSPVKGGHRLWEIGNPDNAWYVGA